MNTIDSVFDRAEKWFDEIIEILPRSKTVIGAVTGTVIAAVTACGSNTDDSGLFGPGSGAEAGTAGATGGVSGSAGKAGSSGQGGANIVGGGGGVSGSAGQGGAGAGGVSIVGGNGGTVSGAAGVGGVVAGSAGVGGAGAEAGTGGVAGTDAVGGNGGSVSGAAGEGGAGGSGGAPVALTLDFTAMNESPCFFLEQRRGDTVVHVTPDQSPTTSGCEFGNLVLTDVQTTDKFVVWFRPGFAENKFKFVSSIPVNPALEDSCTNYSNMNKSTIDTQFTAPGYTPKADTNSSSTIVEYLSTCPSSTYVRFSPKQ